MTTINIYFNIQFIRYAHRKTPIWIKIRGFHYTRKCGVWVDERVDNSGGQTVTKLPEWLHAVSLQTQVYSRGTTELSCVRGSSSVFSIKPLVNMFPPLPRANGLARLSYIPCVQHRERRIHSAPFSDWRVITLNFTWRALRCFSLSALLNLSLIHI